MTTINPSTDREYRSSDLGTCIRLNNANFPIWIQQVEVLLQGGNLYDICKGIETPPEQFNIEYVPQYAPQQDTREIPQSTETLGPGASTSEAAVRASQILYVQQTGRFTEKRTVNPTYTDYMKRKNKAYTVLYSTLSSSAQLSVCHCRDAHSIWKTIQSIYGYEKNTGLAARLFFDCVKREFMKKGEDVQTWSGRLKGYQMQLKGTSFEITDQVLREVLLDGLPKRWNNIRDSIRAYTNDETLDATIDRLLKQDTKNTHPDTNTSNTLANLSVTGYTPTKKFNPRKDRSGGNKKGEGQKDKDDEELDDDTCNGCGERGHWVRDCPERKKSNQQKSRQQKKRKTRKENKEKDSQTAELAITAHSDVSENFENYEANTVLTTVATNPWILDSGASTNYTMEKSDLNGYKRFGSPMKIKCANGGSLKAYGKGTAHISPKLSIEAWWVPGLSHKLISTGALLRSGHKIMMDKTTQILNSVGEVVAIAQDNGVSGVQAIVATATVSGPVEGEDGGEDAGLDTLDLSFSDCEIESVENIHSSSQ